MTRPALIVAGIAAAILLLLGAYLGTYYAMLEGAEELYSESQFITDPILIEPRYRSESAMVKNVFVPAKQFDRLIRPNYWK